MNDFRIGIDPDLTSPGVAQMQEGVYTVVGSVPFIELQKVIYAVSAIYTVENVLAIKATFDHLGDYADKNYFGDSAPGSKSDQARRDKISQNVGACKAACKIIIATLEDAGRQYELVKPLAATRSKSDRDYYNRCHEDADFFKRVTGWQERTNHDARAAAMLLFRYSKPKRGGV